MKGLNYIKIEIDDNLDTLNKLFNSYIEQLKEEINLEMIFLMNLPEKIMRGMTKEFIDSND